MCWVKCEIQKLKFLRNIEEIIEFNVRTKLIIFGGVFTSICSSVDRIRICLWLLLFRFSHKYTLYRKINLIIYLFNRKKIVKDHKRKITINESKKKLIQIWLEISKKFFGLRYWDKLQHREPFWSNWWFCSIRINV